MCMINTAVINGEQIGVGLKCTFVVIDVQGTCC